MTTTRLFIHNKPRNAPARAVRGFFMGAMPWAAAVALVAVYAVLGSIQ